MSWSSARVSHNKSVIFIPFCLRHIRIVLLSRFLFYVCPSVYYFWIPHWYLQTFLTHMWKKLVWTHRFTKRAGFWTHRFTKRAGFWCVIANQESEQWYICVLDVSILPLSMVFNCILDMLRQCGVLFCFQFYYVIRWHLFMYICSLIWIGWSI
jgi:hypothetical protein